MQRLSDHGMLSPKVFICSTVPTLKAQGHLGRETGKSIRTSKSTVRPCLLEITRSMYPYHLLNMAV